MLKPLRFYSLSCYKPHCFIERFIASLMRIKLLGRLRQ